MALTFKGLEPVQFGDKLCTPEVDAEARLRLGRLEGLESDKAVKTLAACFPDDEAFVAEFITEKMGTNDRQYLQAYLIGGERAVAQIERTLERYMDEAVAKAKENRLDD